MGRKPQKPSVSTEVTGSSANESLPASFNVAKEFLQAILKHTADLVAAMDADLADSLLQNDCELYRTGKLDQPPNGQTRVAWQSIADDIDSRVRDLCSANKEMSDFFNSDRDGSLAAVTFIVAETEFEGLGRNGEILRLLFGNVLRQFGELHQAVAQSLADGGRISIAKHPAFWRILRDIQLLEDRKLLGRIRTSDRPREADRTIEERAWWLCWLLNEWSDPQRWASWNANLECYLQKKQEQIAIDDRLRPMREIPRGASLPDVLLVHREYENRQRVEIEPLTMELFPELLPQLPSEVEFLEPVTDIDARVAKYRRVASEIMVGFKATEPPSADIDVIWIKTKDLANIISRDVSGLRKQLNCLAANDEIRVNRVGGPTGNKWHSEDVLKLAKTSWPHSIPKLESHISEQRKRLQKQGQ